MKNTIELFQRSSKTFWRSMFARRSRMTAGTWSNVYLAIEGIVFSEKDRRGQADEVSSRLVQHRSEIGLVVCRVGELFRKQARPSPSSNGRESISEPLFEKEELLPSTGPMFHVKTYRSWSVFALLTFFALFLLIKTICHLGFFFWTRPNSLE